MARRNTNVVVVSGNVVRDPEIKNLPSGMFIAEFSIAVNGYANKEETTDYFNMVSFGKTAEAIGKYVTKGTPLLVSGSLQQQRWQGKDGKNKSSVRVIANRVEFLGGKKNDGEEKEEAPF